MTEPDQHRHVVGLPRWLAFGERADRWAAPMLAAVAVVIFLSNLVVAVIHLYDRFHVSHVSGTWLALDWYVRHGTLYPPLFEDGYFGGTRFSPLAILWNSLFGLLIDHPIAATKMAAIVAVTAVLVALYHCMRRIGVPRPLAFMLTASVIVTEPGFVAATAPFRGDPAPIALQLVALLLVARPDRRMVHVVVAAVLCALAVFFKLTAGYAIIAIGLFLLANDRRQLLALCAVWFPLVGIGFVGFNALSHGHYVENIFGLSASNIGGFKALLGAPGAMNYILIESARVTWVGLPLGFVSVARALNSRRLSLFQIAWLVSGALLLIMLTDSGVSFNHFLAFTAMTSLVIAELWVSLDPTHPTNVRTDRALLVVALLWTSAGDFDRVVADPLRASLRAPDPTLEISALRSMLDADDRLLSEDPLLPILIDHRPVIIDAWMITKIGARYPEYVEALIQRVANRDFTKVILLVGMEEPVAPIWYQQHFGPEFIEAVQEHYTLKEVRLGYRIWVPKPATPVAPE